MPGHIGDDRRLDAGDQNCGGAASDVAGKTCSDHRFARTSARSKAETKPRRTVAVSRPGRLYGDDGEHVGGGARGCAMVRRLRCEFARAFGLIRTREHHRVVLTQRRRLWWSEATAATSSGGGQEKKRLRASYGDAQGTRRGKEGGRSSPSGSRWPVVSLVAAELDANGGASVVDGEATSKPKTRGLSGSCCWAIGRGRGPCSY